MKKVHLPSYENSHQVELVWHKSMMRVACNIIEKSQNNDRIRQFYVKKEKKNLYIISGKMRRNSKNEIE